MTMILDIEWNVVENRYELVNNHIKGFRQVLATSLDRNKLTKGVYEA